jgi:cytochrome d ubiquinol oxidase subunit I
VRGKLPRWLLTVLENGEVVTFMAIAVALLAIAIVVFVSGVHGLVVAPAWWSRCPSPWSWCGVTPGSTAPERRRLGLPVRGMSAAARLPHRESMTVLLSRWQFGITITYHFLFVPLTIGLALLVAVMQTLAYRKRDGDWERLSRFFGMLFLINLAMGIVTGIVQEFQFGMNWSDYSVFVGNIFGAPLAMEGLFAFFLESTFVGLWMFGRGRLSPRVHLATIWTVSVGSIVSAFFILAANSWMQHPVGYRIVDHKAELTDFWAVLRNSTLWWAFAHTVLASFLTGAMLVLGVSAWHLLKGRDTQAFRRSARLSAAFGFIISILVIFSGDSQARLFESQQPMKMAAAEALYHTTTGASFSLLTIGNLSGIPIFQIRVPHLESLIADLSWNGKVDGIYNIQHAEVLRYGPGSYIPVIWVTYWGFRIMVGLGFLMLAATAWTCWLSRRRAQDRLQRSRWTLRVLVACIAAPFLANTAGWIFTEMGRQPWIVYGLLRTDQAFSPNVSATDVAITLGLFVLLYTVLGIIDGLLMTRTARHGLGPRDEDRPPQQEQGQGGETSHDLVY